MKGLAERRYCKGTSLPIIREGEGDFDDEWFSPLFVSSFKEPLGASPIFGSLSETYPARFSELYTDDDSSGDDYINLHSTSHVLAAHENSASKCIPKPFFTKVKGLEEGFGGNQEKIKSVKALRNPVRNNRPSAQSSIALEPKDLSSINKQWADITQNDSFKYPPESSKNVNFSAGLGESVDSLGLNDIILCMQSTVALKSPITPMDSGFESSRASRALPLTDNPIVEPDGLNETVPYSFMKLRASLLAPPPLQLEGAHPDGTGSEGYDEFDTGSSSSSPRKSLDLPGEELTEVASVNRDRDLLNKAKFLWLKKLKSKVTEILKTPAQRRREEKGKDKLYSQEPETEAKVVDGMRPMLMRGFRKIKLFFQKARH
ncbi:hypothetical protein HDU67_006610 [Dinochytrium kinnereticum]|nr:hypothetical protein HDU67_006610 [Dinochytrium kinnereticum]